MTKDGIVRQIVNSQERLVLIDKTLEDMWHEHKHLTVTIRPGRDRSVEQNNLWAAQYKRIAQTLSWTFPHARAHCKLYVGIPILQRDCDGFDKSFKRIFGELTTEQALRLMNANNLFPTDGFPVTRHFGTKQGCEYTDGIVNEFMGKVSFVDLLKD